MIHVHVDGAIFALQAHGGISRQFRNLIHALSDRGATCLHLYLPPGGASRESWPRSVRIKRYPRTPRIRPGRVFGRVNEALRLLAQQRMWASITEGVFHSTHYTTYESLSIPQVFTLHDMIYEKFSECFPVHKRDLHIEEKRRCAEAARAIVCPSRCSLDDAQSHYDMDGKITKVVPHAVDPAFRPINDAAILDSFRRRFALGSEFILHCGARVAHKNFIGLLAAYAQWDRRGRCKLLAAGGGPSTPEELSITQGFGIRDSVVFLPTLSEEELVVAYNASRAVIVPSLYEGFGFPALEALACGKPVAVAAAGSLPEVAGSFGVYFDPYVTNDIVQVLSSVLSLETSREWSEKAMRFATRRTWADVAADYEAVYEQTLCEC